MVQGRMRAEESGREREAARWTPERASEEAVFGTDTWCSSTRLQIKCQRGANQKMFCVAAMRRILA